MQNTLNIPTEAEYLQSIKPNEFVFISDGRCLGLYFNTGQEIVGVKQKDPNFLWTPEFKF